MEGSANFIPLGVPKGQRGISAAKPKPQKVEGETPEERKRIAAEIRKANKKEKKLIKADAKRQRKQNAVMHRRMTKNPEKYTKNKERNRLRAIEAERQKVQRQAIQQAQRLAAKYDPSGKMFNVGEVVTLEDGTVKSKEALANAERRKAEKEAERAAKEAEKENPDASKEPVKKSSMSKRQQAKQKALEPRPLPPRPVLPEGINIPEGEENFIAMWDITDEQVLKRLSDDKRRKSLARRDLRRQQKAQKKINKAMKLLKRQTENMGIKWDPVEGRKIVMKQQEDDSSSEDSQQSSDDDSEDEAQNGEEVKVEQTEHLVEPAKVEKKSKKSEKHSVGGNAAVEPPALASEPDSKPAKSSKRAADDGPVEEPKPKKNKKSKKSQNGDINTEEVTDNAGVIAVPESESAFKEEERGMTKEEKRALKEQKRAQKEAKKAEKEKKRQEESAEASIPNGESSKSSKKRKHEDDAADAPLENEKSQKKKKNKSKDSADMYVQPQSDLPESLDKHDKYYTSSKATEELQEPAVAAQWNPEALTGEAARKEKFLRLLGAGKANVKPADAARHKSSSKVADISKVQSDLERQYEAGMKMKHDGGSKRRGLGA